MLSGSVQLVWENDRVLDLQGRGSSRYVGLKIALDVREWKHVKRPRRSGHDFHCLSVIIHSTVGSPVASPSRWTRKETQRLQTETSQKRRSFSFASPPDRDGFKRDRLERCGLAPGSTPRSTLNKSCRCETKRPLRFRPLDILDLLSDEAGQKGDVILHLKGDSIEAPDQTFLSDGFRNFSCSSV